MSDIKSKPHTISVKELLENRELTIPDYQRPYKWTERNVNQLIDDILGNTDKSSYRIGTLVLHHDTNDDKNNIVDGQQRTITLTLIALALIKEGMLEKQNVINRECSIESFTPKYTLSFSNIVSQYNVKNNYKVIVRRINEFDAKAIRFFYYKCELVQVILDDLSQAFQFFDSQNARGKDLEPHDLLKAFHLRAMNHLPEDEITKAVSQWEKFNTRDLSDIFEQYLFRIRNWGKDCSARYFTKDDVDIFKGVSLDGTTIYPFAQVFRIANYYTDDYNRSVFSRVNGKELSYPFQIDQCIVNGKPFFEMVAHYTEVIKKLQERDDDIILRLIHNYEACDRTGDRYVRNLFYCGLLYYIDRFGETELNRVIVKLFIWAYTLRLSMYSVGVKSIDNYALGKDGVRLFKIIKEANSPKEILNIPLAVVRQNHSTKTDDIVKKFEELKYYEAKN